MIKRRLLYYLTVLFFLVPWVVQAQSDGLVTGTVKDGQSQPLPGVSIMVKGTSTGTTTDADGKFKLQVGSADATLVFSFVGFQSQEAKVGSQTEFNIVLTEDISTLQEVVVVGYGEMKKSDLTGSVATLKGDNLNKTPASSMDQLLQGKIAGVQVITNGGQPGSGATIRIRGASSLNGSKDPLVVVDGYPWGDAGNLKQINPDDIESIEVLKDASAAAIYGSRGANGVILVTTRKGRSGSPRITFNTLQTVSTLAVKPDVWRDPVEQATYDNEAATTGGSSPADIPFIGTTRGGVYYPSIAELRGLDPNKPQWPYNTDWVDLVYRNPHSQSYTLTADGGSDKTKYSISGNYYKEDGLVIANGYDKYTGRMNLDQKLTNAVTVGTNVILAYTNSRGQQLGAGRSPIWPVYDANGDYFKTSATDFGNPIALANELYNKTKTFDLLASVYANIKITDWLQFRTTLNTKFGNSVQDQYDPINSTQRALDNKGSYGSIVNGNYNDLLNENYFTINKTFGDVHVITLTGGFSIQKTTNRFSTLTGQNFVNDVLQNENLGSAGTMLISNDLQRFGLQSWYGRANYVLKDRYLFTLTGRADGSTKFGADNKWAFFPSGAVAWKIHEENFMQAIPAVSDLKLRASYGLTGNQGIAPYQTQDRFGSYKYYVGTGFKTGFGPGFAGANDEQGRTVVSGLGNSKLKWETTKSFDVGLDIGILDQRFTLTADYYIKNTSDLLRLQTIAPSSGFDRQWINDGEISNRGVELGLNAEVLTTDALTWTVGANFTMNRNRVVSMGESDRVLIGTLYESVRQQISTYTVNQPMYAFYGYKTDGIIQTLEEGIKAGLTGRDAEPGEIKYLDISGPEGKPDGVVNELDRTIIGNPNPNFIYSFNTNVRYKQFDFSAQLYGVQGNDVFDFQKMSPSRQLQRWTLDNPSNDYPRANNSRGYRASDFFLTDGSFLRLQNVTVGYNLPSETIKGVKSLRVFFSGNNLYTFTGFHGGFDPEVGELSINNGSYPRPRAFTLGLNIGL
ncbi:SusC/RagA family TonB-linked outer membrane protein [Chryseolinea lacunae]|uniref:TonB-dependent receptor n=1 Tax=Chryseolinea lacunae TaxID=2801331 RepID=A0ABS1KYA5_9BACT|nr:TonB-dependent receptor [Chryseolinea lacunae]MBL0744423.1 TonB-dependent receptor [Chryseolinea lacunae]